MPVRMRKCMRCGEYTLSQTVCPRCGGLLRLPTPPKFSMEDKYGRYRRALRKQMEARSEG